MSIKTVQQLKTVKSNTKSTVEAELSRTGGLLRLAPAWVPRSFLQPGLRIKLHPDDTYAYGADRGGIDEHTAFDKVLPDCLNLEGMHRQKVT